MNGSSVRPDKGKVLKCAISNSSTYADFWNKAIIVFNSMRFVSADGKRSSITIGIDKNRFARVR